MSTPPVVLPSHLPGQVADRLAGPRDTTALAAALERLLADRPALVGWLGSLVDDPDRLTQVVNESYWHANGFAKLVLHSGAGFRIRLHVWPTGEGRRGEPDPHSHRWDFASSVLAGDGLDIVESVELLEADSVRDEPCTRYVYDGFGLVPDTKVFLRETRRYAVLTHQRYTTDTRAIHTVAPQGSDLVATLLVQGPHISSATAVYGTDLDDLVDRPGRPIDAADVRELVADVAALVPRG